MQTISESETSETVCQESYVLVDTSLVDIPYTIFDTSTCVIVIYLFMLFVFQLL